jgi:hypothetical protein
LDDSNRIWCSGLLQCDTYSGFFFFKYGILLKKKSILLYENVKQLSVVYYIAFSWEVNIWIYVTTIISEEKLKNADLHVYVPFFLFYVCLKALVWHVFFFIEI